jgi:hypothetical protein
MQLWQLFSVTGLIAAAVFVSVFLWTKYEKMNRPAKKSCGSCGAAKKRRQAAERAREDIPEIPIKDKKNL